MNYRETQFGWIVISIIGAVIVFLAVAHALQLGDKPTTLGAFISLEALMVGIILMFHKMTTEVTTTSVRVSYGIGLIKVRIPLDRVLSCEVKRVPFWYGIGIRVTPEGMMYNMTGFNVVKVTYTKGSGQRSVMIGTRTPEKLKAALAQGK